jgi:hypothetical protein
VSLADMGVQAPPSAPRIQKVTNQYSNNSRAIR